MESFALEIVAVRQVAFFCSFMCVLTKGLSFEFPKVVTEELLTEDVNKITVDMVHPTVYEHANRFLCIFA